MNTQDILNFAVNQGGIIDFHNIALSSSSGMLRFRSSFSRCLDLPLPESVQQMPEEIELVWEDYDMGGSGFVTYDEWKRRGLRDRYTLSVRTLHV